MKTKIYFILSLLIALSSCGDDPVLSSDYRDQYVGTYECTKSSRSFEDMLFRTEIADIIIAIPANTDSIITLDGIELSILEDGTTGQITYDGSLWDLFFEDATLKMKTAPLINGLAAPCYIVGEKK